MPTRSIDKQTLKAIGKRVKRARDRRGYSQQDLAIELRNHLPKRSKVSGPMISLIENGSVAAGLDTMAALSVVLDLNLAELAPEYVDDASRMHSVLTLVVGRGQRQVGSACDTRVRAFWTTNERRRPRRVSRRRTEILMRSSIQAGSLDLSRKAA